ncbi:MAG: hypothetical protein BWZ10_00810 [candidate division BRC1 bacterium ADurb.BinA364]|nr:MAG: hypothetical protein BWZ10_00810 [candidate division BRC1 bacterium ADurb.BinA364]
MAGPWLANPEVAPSLAPLGAADGDARGERGGGGAVGGSRGQADRGAAGLQHRSEIQLVGDPGAAQPDLADFVFLECARDFVRFAWIDDNDRIVGGFQRFGGAEMDVAAQVPDQRPNGFALDGHAHLIAVARDFGGFVDSGDNVEQFRHGVIVDQQFAWIGASLEADFVGHERSAQPQQAGAAHGHRHDRGAQPDRPARFRRPLRQRPDLGSGPENQRRGDMHRKPGHLFAGMGIFEEGKHGPPDQPSMPDAPRQNRPHAQTQGEPAGRQRHVEMPRLGHVQRSVRPGRVEWNQPKSGPEDRRKRGLTGQGARRQTPAPQEDHGGAGQGARQRRGFVDDQARHIVMEGAFQAVLHVLAPPIRQRFAIDFEEAPFESKKRREQNGVDGHGDERASGQRGPGTRQALGEAPRVFVAAYALVHRFAHQKDERHRSQIAARQREPEGDGRRKELGRQRPRDKNQRDPSEAGAESRLHQPKERHRGRPRAQPFQPRPPLAPTRGDIDGEDQQQPGQPGEEKEDRVFLDANHQAGEERNEKGGPNRIAPPRPGFETQQQQQGEKKQGDVVAQKTGVIHQGGRHASQRRRRQRAGGADAPAQSPNPENAQTAHQRRPEANRRLANPVQADQGEGPGRQVEQQRAMQQRIVAVIAPGIDAIGVIGEQAFVVHQRPFAQADRPRRQRRQRQGGDQIPSRGLHDAPAPAHGG